MTLKSVLVNAAFCLSILALSPLANAAGIEKKVTIVGEAKTPDAVTTPVQDTHLATKDSTAEKSLSSGEKPALTAKIAFVAKSTAAHTAMTGHGKPAEEAKSPSTSSNASTRVTTSSRAMAVVGEARKSKAEKNAGGKPSSEATSTSGSSAKSGAKGATQPTAQIKVIAAAKKAKAEKNASGKPSEQPKSSGISHGSSQSSSSSHSSIFHERVGAISPSGRGSPGERATHCNARGMCF